MKNDVFDQNGNFKKDKSQSSKNKQGWPLEYMFALNSTLKGSTSLDE